MRKIWIYLSALLCLAFTLTGCDAEAVITESAAILEQQIESEMLSEEADDVTDEVSEDLDAEVSEGMSDEALPEEISNDVSGDESEQEEVSEEADEVKETVAIDENGSYTSRDEVALYIYTYGKLPKNFITKQEAEALGWVSKEGNLHEVAPGMSIGGNRFGNYEQQLPDGKYKECDINYSGGYRGDERLIYSEDGAIYYTDDHYATFTQLY